MNDSIQRLRQAAINFYASPEVSEGLGERADAHVEIVLNGLKNLPSEMNEAVIPDSQEVVRYWDEVSTNCAPILKTLAEAARDCAKSFRWICNENYRGYPGFEEHFFKNEAYTEIFGPNGLLVADNFRLGLFMLGDNTWYPFHSHEATELYHVLSGTAIWQQSDKIERKHPPGTAIYHSEWETHAMQTTEPLLAMWTWTGAIEVPIRVD